MKFRKLELDPAHNPGVLATGTWDRPAAWQAVRRVGEGWAAVQEAALQGRPLPRVGTIVTGIGSRVCRGAAVFCLARLADGQQVFIELGRGGGALGGPLGELTLGRGLRVAAYPTDAAVIDRYCRVLEPANRPQALGATPRLGIGTRMTTAVWPGVFQAMDRRGFAANSIQNSVRELNLVDDLLAARPAPTNYACGFGTIESGYTGSSWEGLWVAGVLAALAHDRPLRYGADADHLQVKRGADGLARAKRLIEASRYYTFYTLDMADVLDYAALAAPAAAGMRMLRRKIPGERERKAVLAWHRQRQRPGAAARPLNEAMIGRFVGKYWDALAALAELSDHLSQLKEGGRFDLEFTIDEHPPEVAAFDCLTTGAELQFVLGEIRRRGLPVTHVAPNFGQEKGWDYRCPDGLAGLEKRVRTQCALAAEYGVLLDFHSADDLSQPVRRVIRRATGGRHHYKISPILQLLYADALADHHPVLFRHWWNDALAYAQREAAAGSQMATLCLRAYAAAPDRTPSRHHPLFHHYSFAFVGRRNRQGRFLHREKFYRLSADFYRDYARRTAHHLCLLADDLF